MEKGYTIIKFKPIPRERFESVKRELLKTFDFVKVRRHPQKYALGGFSITPKNHEKGFINKEIDKLCEWLCERGYDNENLDMSRDLVYGEEHGEWVGKKVKYLTLKDGINFLMKLDC